jgi:hypothetical protein
MGYLVNVSDTRSKSRGRGARAHSDQEAVTPGDKVRHFESDSRGRRSSSYPHHVQGKPFLDYHAGVFEGTRGAIIDSIHVSAIRSQDLYSDRARHRMPERILEY